VSSLCLQCPADAKSFAARRGLCFPCYGRSRRAVQRGATTWEKLERKGQALPAQPPGLAWRKGCSLRSGKRNLWEIWMKLSAHSSYALHALVHLARSKPGQSVPSHVIAQADGTPERFLLKILKPLVTARILHAVKGPHGGYRLARVPAKISVLEVVEAVDGPLRVRPRPLAWATPPRSTIASTRSA